MTAHKILALLCSFAGMICLLFGLTLLTDTPTAVAQEATEEPTEEPQAEPVSAASGGDNYCLVCHTEQTSQMHTFADGSQVSIAVDPEVLANSAHGADNPEGALACVDCHGEDIFPHTAPPAANARESQITRSNICVGCHTEEAENLADGVHYTALVAGNLRAATCIDCHGGHNSKKPEAVGIAQTCATCHQIIGDEYSQSAHGVALMNGDPNVPTCIDCHGVHGIQHPTTALFRNRSPELCAECHADAELMEQYGISTNVFNSYLTDFHGSTVALFEQAAPGVASNKAVCYDCHGVHDIAPADAANRQLIRENLLETCRECHPSATADFPDAWVGHFPPTLESQPLLYTVNLFYDILIPAVLGAFALLVLTDIFRRIRQIGRRSEAAK